MKKSKRVATLVLALTLSLSTAAFTFASDSVSTGSGSVSTGSGSISTGSGSISAGSGSISTGSGSTSKDTATTTIIGVEKILVNGVIKGSIKLTSPSEAVKAEFNSNEKLITLLGNKYIAGATVEQLGAQELNAAGLTAEDFAAGVNVTFNVSTVKAEDTVIVLHKRSTDNQWEVLDANVADGLVGVTFHSFSPVVFVKVAGGNVLPSSDTTSEPNSTSTTSSTSPKTGMNGFIFFAELVAVLSLAGIAVISRKKSIVK